MINLTEHADDTAVIDTGDQYGQQIGKQGGLFLEVEGQRLVVAGASWVSHG